MQISDDTPVGELNLSVRATNVLRNNKIMTFGEMRRLSADEISQMPNAGAVTIQEILRASGNRAGASAGWLAMRKRQADLHNTRRPLRPAGRSVYMTVDEMDAILSGVIGHELKAAITNARKSALIEYKARAKARG